MTVRPVLTSRQTLRIVDLEGKQAVDFLCYNADDIADRYNAADTMKYNKNVYGRWPRHLLRAGDPALHDCGGHDGRRPRYHRRLLQRRQQHVPLQGAGHAELLRELPRALAPHGMGEKDIVADINFFMNVPVQPDGIMGTVDGRSKPGDYVELGAALALPRD